VEAVTYASTVDSLLAVKYLVFDKKECTMDELIKALKDNWEGHEILRAKALNKAPKYGRDDDQSDEMGRKVMELWTEESWKYKTSVTGKQFRPGMLSWNYWISTDIYFLPAPTAVQRASFYQTPFVRAMGPISMGPLLTLIQSVKFSAEKIRREEEIGKDISACCQMAPVTR